MDFLSVIVLIGAVGIIAALSYSTYNLYVKYSELEETAQANLDFILSIRSRVLSQRSYLKQLDRKGAFEADDEVGYFFKELKKIVNDISTYLELEVPPEDEQPDQKIIRSRITSEF